MMLLRNLSLLTALSFLLAGCTTEDPDAMDDGMHEVMIDADSYTLNATGVPETAVPGEAFTFTLKITGPAGMSDHIGGHFWNDTVESPDPDDATIKPARKNCAHVPGGGDLPGTFEITCTIDDEGVTTLFGHLAYTDGETTYNYWDGPFSIRVSS